MSRRALTDGAANYHFWWFAPVRIWTATAIGRHLCFRTAIVWVLDGYACRGAGRYASGHLRPQLR